MKRSTHPVCCALVVLAACGWTRAQAAAKQPGPPQTGRYSVLMFAGKTEFCWITLWPPSTNADDTPITPGTKVKVKVYRSYDGGKTYTTRGVSIVDGGEGAVGQGEKDPREMRYINCKLKTPVDNKKPFAVHLAASVIVDGVESKKINQWLTFCYVGRDGRPRLIRYETPDITGVGVDDELARPLPQELPGKWTGGHFGVTQITYRESLVEPSARKYHRALVAFYETVKSKPLEMVINIKEIDLVGAPGLNGNPVDPLQAKKIHFPGKLALTMHPPGAKTGKEDAPIGFMYNYRERSIRYEKRDKTSFARFGGHFFQTATHYTFHGTWKTCLMVDGKETLTIVGTWSGKKRKK